MGKRSLAIIGGVFILCGVVLAYWVWTRSPSYSFHQIVRALQNHDLATFEQYVDVESVATRMIDDLLAQSTKDTNTESAFEKAGQALGLGLVHLMKPQLVNLMKQQVARFVEKGSFQQEESLAENDEDSFSLKSIAERLGSSYETFQKTEYVRRSGKIAHIGLLFQPKAGSDIIVELKLRDMGGYWQVAEISNLSKLLTTMCNRERERIEKERERIEKANQPIRQLINKSLSLRDASMTGRADQFGISKDIYFRVATNNTSGKKVVFFSGRFIITTLDGRLFKEVPMKSEQAISPGDTEWLDWKMHVNMFDSDSVKLYQTVSSSVALKVKIDKVTFADGSSLALQETVQEKKC